MRSRRTRRTTSWWSTSWTCTLNNTPVVNGPRSDQAPGAVLCVHGMVTGGVAYRVRRRAAADRSRGVAAHRHRVSRCAPRSGLPRASPAARGRTYRHHAVGRGEVRTGPALDGVTKFLVLSGYDT